MIRGNDRANVLFGTSADDIIFGFGGNDQLYGRGGADTIHGGNGDDVLSGDVTFRGLPVRPGADYYDKLFGGAGNDDCHGGPDTYMDMGTGHNIAVAHEIGREYVTPMFVFSFGPNDHLAMEGDFEVVLTQSHVLSKDADGIGVTRELDFVRIHGEHGQLVSLRLDDAKKFQYHNDSGTVAEAEADIEHIVEHMLDLDYFM
ncbi:MAG TPA: hypothetical protein VLA89_09285 [Gemmatimonadales bacterium]|nr:hypothetical protein [Gemmatimonadales bacterium]